MAIRLAGFLLVTVLFATAASAQERRGIVYGAIGGATIGHADSEQGSAPIFGGGVGFHLTPRLMAEADVHRASVSNVFGRVQHDFTETMFTVSLLFRSSPASRVHFIGGGGVAFQRAHTEVDDPPFLIDRAETIRHWHGRLGADWDLSDRLALRTEGVLWFGPGLDWVTGARVSLGYRF